MGAAAGEPTPVTLGDGSVQRLKVQSVPAMDAQPAWKGKINGVRINEKESGTTEWNTKNLGRRLAVDAASAATAGGLVAPIITMIDK